MLCTSVKYCLYNSDGSVRAMYKNFSSGTIDLVGKAINEFLDNSDMIAQFGMDFVPEHTYFGMQVRNNNGIEMTICINYMESDRDKIDVILHDINQRT